MRRSQPLIRIVCAAALCALAVAVGDTGVGVGFGGDIPLVGDPEMYELIEYRRRRIEVATVKEWEWGMFSKLAPCFNGHPCVEADPPGLFLRYRDSVRI